MCNDGNDEKIYEFLEPDGGICFANKLRYFAKLCTPTFQVGKEELPKAVDCL